MGQKFHLFVFFSILSFLGFAQSPVASFIVGSDTNLAVVKVCNGYQIKFLDNSVGATTYSWSFSGGLPAASAAQNPIVSFSNNGLYNCSYTVFNTSGGSNSINFQVQVSSNVTNPTFGFLADVCSSDPSFLLNVGSYWQFLVVLAASSR